MTSPAAVATKMEETRGFLRKIWGEEEYLEKMMPIVKALRQIAEKTNRDPFQLAIDEAHRAGAEGKDSIVWQMTAAACEIAEGRWEE